MNYLEFIPTELIDIVISLLPVDDVKSLYDILPYPELVNWFNIYKYYFEGSIRLPYPSMDKDKYITYVSIEALKNKLTGTRLSGESIEKIFNKEIISLSNRGLSNLPKEIGVLTNLKTLNLLNNKLTSLPKEISNLTNLETLNLLGNKLTSLPKEIGNLTKLQDLDLDQNKLVSLPKELGNLTNLQALSVVNNESLSSLPIELDNLTKLTYFDLFGTNLTISDVPKNLRRIAKF